MDKQAKKILFKTYWSSAGWVPKADRQTEPSDFAYAKQHGVMFDPLVLTHTELKAACEELVQNIPKKKVTDAFLSSFSAKRPDWRSALASHANLITLLKSGAEYFYDVDAEDDVNVLNFERIKWGGIRHGQALYNYFDLRALQNETVPEPTTDDITLFKNILHTISASEATDTATVLRDKIKAVWTVSKAERATLLEILGCSGILETLDFDRPEPGRHDWNFVAFWRGQDKYNQKQLDYYFKDYNL